MTRFRLTSITGPEDRKPQGHGQRRYRQQMADGHHSRCNVARHGHEYDCTCSDYDDTPSIEPHPFGGGISAGDY